MDSNPIESQYKNNLMQPKAGKLSSIDNYLKEKSMVLGPILQHFLHLRGLGWCKI